MFSWFFIDRPKFALVISLVIVLGGGISISVIPVAEFPDITPPQVRVQTSYPGASAEVVEQSVAAAIEAQVNGVDDMLYMSSTSSNDGRYELTVTFEVGTNPDIAAVNVQNRVAVATQQLPEEVTRQGVTTRKQSSSLLLVVNVVSPQSSRSKLFLSNYASIYLEDTLARINGVGSVSQFGALDYGMRVWLRPDRLTALGLTTSDVASSIRTQNIQASVGQLGAPPFENEPQFQFTLQAQGRLVTVEEFEQIVVRANPDGSFVRLADVARVELGSQIYSSDAKLNNRPTAAIGIYLSPGANALSVAKQVRSTLERLSARFPPDVEYIIPYDTTRAVEASINGVIETLFVTFMLVVVVTFLFLADWRSTMIPACAIPVSLVGALGVLFLVGYSANTITLFALILAIGVVVDDSIVVVENVQRLMDEKGMEPRQATRQAMAEVTGPVIATTLVLLAVFIPVSFMPGITGELYRQFSLTICVAVVISSLNALTLAPALCALLLRPGRGRRFGPLRWFATLVEKSRNGYARTVGLLIRHLAFTVLALVVFVGATIWLFVQVPQGFLPTEDKGVFFANVQLPDGASLQRTQSVTDRITDALLEIDGIDNVIGISGYSILSGTASNSAFMICLLSPWENRTTSELRWFNILGRVNQRLASVVAADAFAFPLPPISGLGTAGGVEAQVQDLGGGTAQALAEAVRSLAFGANQNPMLSNVFSTYSANVPQLFLEVDRDKAQTMGIPVSEIFTTLQANLGSLYVNDFNLFGKVYKVMIQAEAKDREDVDDVGRIHVRNPAGEMVPLRALLDIRPILGPLTINRYNQFKSAAIQGSPAPGRSTGEAIAAMEGVAETALPEGYVIEWTGTTLQELEAGGLVVAIFALAVVFAYLFLVAQYESWSVPMAVVLSVVIAVFGALVPLYLLPFLDNNLYAQIGIVLLIGLASKTAILMVEFAKLQREAGSEIRVAALEAAQLRFRAVLMTSLSFVFGVMPLMFASGAGAAGRSVVGFVVVGGMGAATVIGIFFIPPLYVLFETWRQKARSLFGARPSEDRPR